jgi:hypothetical protein
VLFLRCHLQRCCLGRCILLFYEGISMQHTHGVAGLVSDPVAAAAAAAIAESAVMQIAL